MKPTDSASPATEGSPRLTDAQMRAEVEKAVAGIGVQRVEVADGNITMTLTDAQDLMLAYADAAMAMLDGKDAANYLEMQLTTSKLLGEIVTLTLQRHRGKTPHQLQKEAESRLSTTTASLERVTAENERLRANRDAWEAFAEHCAHCVECGETSYEACHDGKQLYEFAAFVTARALEKSDAATLSDGSRETNNG